MSYERDVQVINGSLAKVGAQLSDLKDERGEVKARLQHLEQAFAVRETGVYAGAVGPSIGASVLSGLQEDASFQAASEAVSRGMQTSSFAARVGTATKLRAALVGDTAGVGNTGWSVAPERGGIVVPAQRPLRLLDALPHRPTTSDAVEFVQMSVTGDASEQDKQGDVKAELGFAGILRRAEIATIAGWTTASKQVLADAAALQAAIDRVIGYKVLARLENQLINGTGAEGKILGLIPQATAFTATYTAPADKIGEALMQQANAGYSPDIVLMNPLNFYSLQVQKTTDGEYLFGSPTLPLPPALWNTRVVVTPSMAVNTAMVIDSSFVTVLDREQMNVTVSNQHADYFVRNLVAILGELRAGLEVTDPAALSIFTV